MKSVAEQIRDMANRLESLQSPKKINESMEAVLQKAQDAFWHEVARSYPQASSGDFPPDAQAEFDEACKRAIGAWLHYNTHN